MGAVLTGFRDCPAAVSSPPCEPRGRDNPFGNGFDSRSAGVTPSMEVTIRVFRLKPNWLKFAMLLGTKKTPQPPRQTMKFDTRYAKPTRGAYIMAGRERCSRGAPPVF